MIFFYLIPLPAFCTGIHYFHFVYPCIFALVPTFTGSSICILQLRSLLWLAFTAFHGLGHILIFRNPLHESMGVLFLSTSRFATFMDVFSDGQIWCRHGPWFKGAELYNYVVYHQFLSENHYHYFSNAISRSFSCKNDPEPMIGRPIS